MPGPLDLRVKVQTAFGFVLLQNQTVLALIWVSLIHEKVVGQEEKFVSLICVV